jgi:hypothetical protein
MSYLYKLQHALRSGLARKCHQQARKTISVWVGEHVAPVATIRILVSLYLK